MTAYDTEQGGEPAEKSKTMTDKTMTLDYYDAGLLGDGGGGDVSWWQDYIRSELARAHEFYQDQADAITRNLSQPAEHGEAVACDACRGVRYIQRVGGQEKCWKCDGTGYTAPPPAAGVPDAWPKLELWFFRELSSAQRLSLLKLHGFPADEIGESHVWQKNALRKLLSATPSPKAKPHG